MRHNSSVLLFVIGALFFIGCNDLTTGPKSPASSDAERKQIFLL